MNRSLIRNPKDRELVNLVREARFIASSDIYRISRRSRQETSVALKALRREGHIRVVSSAQRFTALASVFAKKTYIYEAGGTPRGHICHWLFISHLRGLFHEAARELRLQLEWSQGNKHKNSIPDAPIVITSSGLEDLDAERGEARFRVQWTFDLEVDCSTEGYRPDLMRQFTPQTLFVAFKSKERLNICERDEWQGMASFHGWWHDLESASFNILKDKCWWNGQEYVSLVANK